MSTWRAPVLISRTICACRGPLMRSVGDVVAKAWVAGDDAPADWSLSRSGGRARVRSGAESTYLAGGVLQLLIAQLRRHIVLLGQR